MEQGGAVHLLVLVGGDHVPGRLTAHRRAGTGCTRRGSRGSWGHPRRLQPPCSVHLRAVACRMRDSRGEADDAGQEIWLRLSRSGATGVEHGGGWLTTVAAQV